jgi:kynurenine formamidase
MMTKLTALSRSITADAPLGSSLPWESPYTTEPIATLKHNGANLFHIEMSPSASTRLLTSRIADPQKPSTRDIDPHVILNRAGVPVLLPASRGEEITASGLQSALDSTVGLEHGDAIVLVTGWGDQDPSALNSEAFITEAPYLGVEACALLASFAEANGSNLVLTDLPYLAQAGGTHIHKEWAAAPPWLRPSWPSANAKTYLQHYYNAGKAAEDWAPTLRVLKSTNLVLGLVGCGRLDTGRLLLNIAPFQVRDVGEVPCTVVAGPWPAE